MVWATKYKQSPKNVNVAGSVAETKKSDAADQDIPLFIKHVRYKIIFKSSLWLGHHELRAIVPCVRMKTS